jgi:hypothetical protein
VPPICRIGNYTVFDQVLAAGVTTRAMARVLGSETGATQPIPCVRRSQRDGTNVTAIYS